MVQVAALQIRQLEKHYQVGSRVLKVLENIDLSVQPGEFICILGASGCGKSTLLRLIIGLENDYKGQILVNGQLVKGTSLERGMVFQEHRLFPWLTVAQNVAAALLNIPMSSADKDQQVRDHIALVGLQGFESVYPAQLSGGMSQRVAIARALVSRPQLLLLDEPFGALDALTRNHLQRELHSILHREGITAVMVTHDAEEAVYLADRIVVMQPHPGRIKRVVEVPMAYPRERNSLQAASIRDDLMSDFSVHPANINAAPDSSPPSTWRLAW